MSLYSFLITCKALYIYVRWRIKGYLDSGEADWRPDERFSVKIKRQIAKNARIFKSTKKTTHSRKRQISSINCQEYMSFYAIKLYQNYAIFCSSTRNN